MTDFLMPGLIFGMVDNVVLILGAGVGNAISDGIGAAIDPTMSHMIIGIILGCLIPLILIPIIETRRNGGK